MERNSTSATLETPTCGTCHQVCDYTVKGSDGGFGTLRGFQEQTDIEVLSTCCRDSVFTDADCSEEFEVFVGELEV